MTEEEAKTIDKETVIRLIDNKANAWPHHLKNLFEEFKNNARSIMSFGPVYNGKVPERWYSQRLFLIGDAAHPYGPGGQGISMALKDAEALCELFDTGISEEKKADFQKKRAEESRQLGESSEKRNRPENQTSSNLGLFVDAVTMKLVHLFNGGKIKL
jgi:2-polyprenyl-6-methoxyphenol hydroxylase-like FAD-dependent oxidoreductase